MNMDSGDQGHDLSVLTWLEEQVGATLLSYLLACDSISLDELKVGQKQPTSTQLEIIENIKAFRASISRGIDDLQEKDLVEHWLIQVMPGGKSVARKFHDQAGGDNQIPSTSDPAEVAMAALAVEVYPAFIMRLDSSQLAALHGGNPYIQLMSFGHPRSIDLCQAVLQDPLLGKVFKCNEELAKASGTEAKYANCTTMLYRNTGTGSTIQLSTLPGILLTTAWQQLDPDTTSLATAVAKAVEQLNLFRKLLEGKPHSAVARQCFAGVLLPPGKNLTLTDGEIRPLSNRERAIGPYKLYGSYQPNRERRQLS